VLAEILSAAGELSPEPLPAIALAPRYWEFLAQAAAARQDWARVLDIPRAADHVSAEYDRWGAA
jgi:hypothetical protein